MRKRGKMKSKLVILRGKPTSGKTTAFHTLKKRKELKDWIFIDFPKIKDKVGKEKGKLKLMEKIKKAMKTGESILIEEMSKETLNKYLSKEIKDCGYKIIIFQFEVSLDEAYKRDVKRAKDKWHPFMGKKQVDELHKMHEERFDEEAVLVDCNKLNKKEVVEFILKKLK